MSSDWELRLFVGLFSMLVFNKFCLETVSGYGFSTYLVHSLTQSPLFFLSALFSTTKKKVLIMQRQRTFGIGAINSWEIIAISRIVFAEKHIPATTIKYWTKPTRATGLLWHHKINLKITFVIFYFWSQLYTLVMSAL